MFSSKNVSDSDRNFLSSTGNISPPYNDDDLDRFQRELNREKIIDIWKKMREGGNSKDGIVQKDKFKQIFYEHFQNIRIKESLINAIFERFRRRDFGKDDRSVNKQKNYHSWSDNERPEIDLHDLVVSLAILSPLNYDDKLELVFDLTDIDEDGCLSPDDVCKMILAIERNFAKESSFIDPENASSLYNVATKKALRRFNYLFLFEGQEEADVTNGGKARKDKLLGHFKDFMEKLSGKQYLYENLLPKTYSIRRVLENKIKEVPLTVHKNDEDAFRRFRSELHGKLWNKVDAEPKMKSNHHQRREDNSRYPYREPGEVTSYGVRTIEEEPRNIENHQEALRNKEPIIQEKNTVPEHKKRLREMRERELPKLEQIMGNKYEKILKRKENHLPSIGKLANDDMRHNNIQIPDLTSMIEKRVERLKKQYKYIGDEYKDYLLNKLTSSVEGNQERNHTAPKKTQAYKFLM